MGRRGWRGRAVAVVVTVLAAGGCWPHHGYDAGRTQWNAGETTLTSADVGELVELWGVAVPGATSLVPAVSHGGTVFAVGLGGDGAVVVALDAATGRLRWAHTVEADDGLTQVWSAAWVDGTLVVPYGVVRYPDPDRGGLLRLDPRTGAVLGDEAMPDAVPTAPAVAGGELAIASQRAIDPSWPWLWQARVEWAYDTTWLTAPSAAFAVVGERLLWSTNFDAVGFSPACPPPPQPSEGGCHWDWATDLGPGEVIGPVALGADRVAYASSHADGLRVSVLDVADGSVEWTWSAPAEQAGELAAADGRLLVATWQGSLVALPAAGCGAPTCTPEWQVRGGASPAFVVAGDVIHAVSGEAFRAYALDGCGAPTCGPIASFPIGGLSLPVVDGGRVFAGRGGSVVALGLPA